VELEFMVFGSQLGWENPVDWYVYFKSTTEPTVRLLVGTLHLNHDGTWGIHNQLYGTALSKTRKRAVMNLIGRMVPR
jgi:hypothetical protein